MIDIYQKISEIITEQLGVEPKEISLDKEIQDDLGADSLDCVELIMSCEERFDIEISDETAEKIKTVRDAVALIEGLVS